MIRNLFDISDKELDKLLFGKVTIYEKLDLIYFKICIDELGVTAYKTPYFKAVDKIDIVCNSIYKDIQKFANDINKYEHKSIYEKFGICTAGFFYMPVAKTKVINYNTVNSPKFFMSDFKCEDPSKYDEDTFEMIFSRYAEMKPFIGEYEYSDTDKQTIKECITECKKDNSSKYDLEELVKAFLLDDPTFTELDYLEIEGLVIKSGKKQYQIIVNDTTPDVNKTITKIYRDTVLKDFAHTILADEQYVQSVISKNNSYMDTICEFFVEYMNRTELFYKFDIEPEDLLPPHIGYFGDMTLELIPSSTAKIVCKYNTLGENILKLFLYTFKQVNSKKFTDMSEEDVKLFIDFETKLHS